MFLPDLHIKGKKQLVLLFFQGALAGIGLNLLFSFLGITAASEAFQKTADIQFSRSFGEGLFLYGVAAPILEEFLFRFVGFRLLRKYFRFWAAMLLSAFLFGIYHGNLVQAAYGFLMGMILAFLMEKYRGLYAPFLFHAGANIGVWSLIYFT